MYPETEQRRGNFGGAIFAAIAVALIAYLGFAALQGEYGLFRLFQIQAQAKLLEADLASLKVEHAAIANKTRRLAPGSLDADLLDEQARKILSLGRPDEIIFR